jgi:cell division protein ZapE
MAETRGVPYGTAHQFPVHFRIIFLMTSHISVEPLSLTDSISARYASLVAAGEIERDRAQEAVIAELARLNDRLAVRRLARKSSSLGWLLGKKDKVEADIKGIYIWGEVGRGKTMLMDLFFAACPVRRKRRAHFHAFMLDVHERLRVYRNELKFGEISGGDPIILTADDLAEEAWVLCFDEFHVTDIADAMILGRLFTRLFERNVVVVATSNVEPAELYRDGLNRALFLPFIDMLQARLNILRLDARTDFRLEKLIDAPVWYVPADDAATAALDAAWRRLTGGQRPRAIDLLVKGHRLPVPSAALGVARFSFGDLCEQPLGAADYLRIAHEFHTVIIDRVPVLRASQRNEAKRFIALIDTLYDASVKLLASAAAKPADLYLGTEGYEASEFKRTASRLIEMGSAEYLALRHGRRTPATSSEGIAET